MIKHKLLAFSAVTVCTFVFILLQGNVSYHALINNNTSQEQAANLRTTFFEHKNQLDRMSLGVYQLLSGDTNGLTTYLEAKHSSKLITESISDSSLINSNKNYISLLNVQSALISDFEAIIDTKLNHDLDRVDNKSSTTIPTLVKINNLADSLSKKIRHANHLSNLIIDSLNERYKAEKLRSEASVESSRQQTMIVILIVTLTLVTTIYLSYQSIQKPISKLIDGVNRVATGDKHVTIEITGNNEYSKLATSFNHMVKEIENQKEELESQEKARQALNTQIQISEAANTHKEQLLSNISHEFRTPLNAILGFAEQISHDQSLSPINEHYLELITQSGNRLSNILEDILLISQSQLEIFDTSNDQFNLTDIIEEIIRTADYYLKDKPILITHDFSSHDGLFFRGDKNKIKHLFNNIILNAAKFTDQGKIAISLLKLNPCTINITDTGPGMSQEDIQDLLVVQQKSLFT